MLNENQILKKPRKIAAPKPSDFLTACNRAFMDGYEKAIKDLNNDHVITYEQARNYIDTQRSKLRQI